MLTVECREQQGICVLTFIGDLIFNQMDDAERVFMEKIGTGLKVIALECKRLNSLDSSGLGLFIKFAKEAGKANVRLVFLDITDHISALFDVSKLDTMFETMTGTEFSKLYPA
ncbi:MAG: STAS domain-containing protein [Spirochaetes bacterium]|nr:STAS domain-containing protein [Spirochaetota bacterium]